jgi:tripartite-type tricarboxylate transporter receptor subunit TctC
MPDEINPSHRKASRSIQVNKTQNIALETRMKNSLLVRLTVAVVFCLGLVFTAQAQQWPTKPIKIVLQFPPGGSTDVVARILSQHMTKSLGQPVLVENKPGADGAIAGDYVVRSEADGHTFFLASNTPMMQVPLLKLNPPYDPIKSFTPVSLMGYYVYVLVASPAIEPKNVKQLLDYGRKNPDKLNYGSYSGVTQLMFSRIKQGADVNLNMINYKGEAPTVSDILGQHIQFTFATPTSTLSHIKAGKLNPMAVLLKDRSPLLPDVPTATEAGLPALGAVTFAAFYGPANLPSTITKKMSDAINAAIKDPEVAEQVAKQGFDLAGSTPEQLGEFTKEQLISWKQAFDSAGLKPD